MTKKKVLITGGNGFIGKYLANKLLSEGFAVRIAGRGKKPLKIPQKVEYFQVDYHNKENLKTALKGCCGVYHLAAAIYGFNYQDFYKANVVATRNLVQACNEKNNIKTFIYVSSLAAGGFTKDVKTVACEALPPLPTSHYGKTKLEGEFELHNLRDDIKHVILRPPIVYGRNDASTGQIVHWIKKGFMINTTSCGDNYFSFVYVEDLVQALFTAFVDAKKFNHQVFYICEDAQYSWHYFVSELSKVLETKTPKMVSVPKPLLHIVAFLYQLSAKMFKHTPALNYDKVEEVCVLGHWICTSKKWISVTNQKFTSLKEGLVKSYK
ncbi:MAG: NAD(P)-dependent oxidoreductase [Elusimicrobiaceae bacterium]|jgi:nucleoside-diphosphate-sugar epimerase|nr:NAD(P)-dependent oxidoreductase [Elusimicrobiaceae bacterium]MBT3955408.1 NAD(P)-dependent oxidoreductase [Elusimicrobiaceae bacterium]MBT4007685.1 NAD(P)-dependent oxidoreductase [Elusimicrobiaceae bacterium]MBT4402305.1 NAD(P)-dependent oxidoreductase [Elusimicrobiaceae bacterium]MBT4439538.1 NAD(P)-dependent oxidoreductase [Elusimicrobiaceae bacterium]